MEGTTLELDPRNLSSSTRPSSCGPINDGALDLFVATLPSPSLVQVQMITTEFAEKEHSTTDWVARSTPRHPEACVARVQLSAEPCTSMLGEAHARFNSVVSLMGSLYTDFAKESQEAKVKDVEELQNTKAPSSRCLTQTRSTVNPARAFQAMKRALVWNAPTAPTSRAVVCQSRS